MILLACVSCSVVVTARRRTDAPVECPACGDEKKGSKTNERWTEVRE
jgi:predicted RNA-binding Zn-ribbon protein involved in translation (DUF1610 family)